MPRFSKRSKNNLRTVHPDLQKIMWTVIEDFDIIVLEGLRGRERQNSLYGAGKTQVRWPDSNHNVKEVPNPPANGVEVPLEHRAHAVDVAPYPVDWDDTEKFHMMGHYILGVAKGLLEAGEIEHEIRWGNDWDRDMIVGQRDPDEDFYDSPHFEIVT